MIFDTFHSFFFIIFNVRKFLIMTFKLNIIVLLLQVVTYISERSESELQIIVISLKEEMYNKASALIGVYPKNTVPCIASGILTYDLKNFNE